jgi:hypothetical protein
MGSVGILVVGLCTGLVAYYAGFPTIALSQQGPPELQYCPKSSAVLAYADVRDVMLSDLRRRLKEIAPDAQADGRETLKRETGIDIENDVDRVTACVTTDEGPRSGLGMVLVSGRFDDVRLEGIARDHGAVVEPYRTKRVLVMPEHSGTPQTLALAFVSPGLIGLGSADLIRHAIDIQAGEAKDSITTNDELMALVRENMNDGNVWAVGRFDLITAKAKLPPEVASRLPAITWFAASGHVNGGINGRLRAETRDEEAANNLRDVIRGLMALARMEAGTNPQVQAMMQALQLGGTGKTVSLSFSVPAEVLEMLTPKKGGALLHDLHERPNEIHREIEKALEKAADRGANPRD